MESFEELPPNQKSHFNIKHLITYPQNQTPFPPELIITHTVRVCTQLLPFSFSVSYPAQKKETFLNKHNKDWFQMKRPEISEGLRVGEEEEQEEEEESAAASNCDESICKGGGVEVKKTAPAP